jgi:metallophosphoesterase superfamily enzyme
MDDQQDIKLVLMQGQIDTLKSKVECLEECEDLRDKQMNVLKTFIETYLTVEIDGIKGNHDGKIGVLSIPKAKD